MLLVVLFLQIVQELVVALDELLDLVDDGVDVLRDGDRDGLTRTRRVQEVVGDAARDEAVLIDVVFPADDCEVPCVNAGRFVSEFVV